MRNSNLGPYGNIISMHPEIDPQYLSGIMRLSADESILHEDITEVRETGTALVIKARASIKGGQGDSVRHLFIKSSKPDEAHNPYREKNMREGAFYALLLVRPAIQLPVPACYDAFVSEAVGAFVIVLDDLAAKYRAPTYADLRGEDVWFSCARSLATFHAAFWNDPLIGTDAFPIMSSAQMASEAQTHRKLLSAFTAQFRDQLDRRTISVFERAMAINTQLIAEQNQRAARRHNVTICHGDSHIHNFMLGKCEAHTPLLVDFQFWGDGHGAGDLAHLTRVSFPESFRKDVQPRLVERYHEAQAENGVTGYSLSDCMNDYRKAVAAMVLIPMWQYTGFASAYEAWKDDVSGLIDNYESMDCDAVYRPE